MEKQTGFKGFLLSTGGRITMIALFYLIIWGVLVALTNTNSPIIGVIYGVLFAFFGWRALNKITPDVFLWMSFMGWIIYFVVKLFLSVVIGLFVAPFQIAKMITNAIQKGVQ